MTPDALRDAAEVCRARPALVRSALAEDKHAWHQLLDHLVRHWEARPDMPEPADAWLRQVAIWTMNKHLTDLSAVDLLALLAAA